MMIQHRMISQPSYGISAVKAREVREEKGGKEEGRRRKAKKKNAKKGNKSNIELKLSNFRYYKNFFETSVTSCR